MKLLAVRIHNLNSLRGTHELRFDQPPLADAGIFAIVGKTGAGKTTILDAITLALYGKTPRDTNGDEVLSNGEAECFAEVEFSSRQGHFRSRWERRRSRGKADGKLQASRREISKQTAEGNWDILEGRIKKEVDRITLKAVGLDYERFTRSVMLTQGEFARFLKAKDNERADLLESITGTELYRQLSTAAYERHQLARRSYDQLKDRREALALLRKEERTLLEEESLQLKKSVDQQRPQLEQLQQRLDRLDQLAQLRKRQAQEQEQFQQLEAKNKAARSDRSRLMASQQLQPLAAEIRELDRSRAQQQQLSKDFEAAQEVQAQTKAQLPGLKSAARTAAKKLADFSKAKPTKEKKLNDARVFQAQIDDRRQLLAKDNQTLAQNRSKNEQLKAKSEQLLQEIKTLEGANTSLQSQLTQLSFSNPENDPTALSLTEQLTKELQSVQVEIQQLKAVQEYRDLLRLELRRTDELEDLEQELISLDQELIAMLEQLDFATEALKISEETWAQLQQSQQLIDLRKSIQNTHEACPVCGATDHPALVHWTPPSEAALQQAKGRVESDTAFLKKRELQLKNLLQEQTRLSTRLQTRQENQEELQLFGQRLAKLETYFAGDGDPLEVAEPELRLKELMTFQEQLSNLTKALEADRGRREELAILQQQKIEVAQGFPALEAEHQQLTQRIEEQQAEMSKWEKQISDLLGGLGLSTAKQRLEQAENSCRQAQQQSELALETAQTKLAGQEQDLKRIEAAHLTLKKDIAKQEKKLQTALKKIGIKELAIAREQLLPVQEEQRLRERLQQLDLAMATNQEVQQQLLQQQKEIVRQLPPELDREELLESLRKAQQEFEAAKERMGGLRQQLHQDDQNRKDAGELMKAIDEAAEELTRWQRLNELIGQKDGGKFRNFAQGLTLARLVQLANRHLEKLNGRYLIHKPADQDLALQIIDTFQADNRRPTSTLSGGESFVLSLALALGLSDLAGRRTRIESLFIDEGFGTLDSSSLEMVMSSLENLRAEGKTIGLISHVPALRERIHHQIRIRTGQEGFSRLEIV
ncbi:MAG: AAA family ATPase [Bacteroidota bacterium]